MFETKVIGMAPSNRLGVIRAIIVLSALYNVISQHFSLLAQTVVPWYRPEGLMRFIPYFRPAHFFAYDNGLLAFKICLILSLVASLVGFFTNISLLISTVLYGFYLGTLRSSTFSLDNGILPLYLMFLMIWIPSGEGFSIDQRCRREYAHLKLDDRPNIAMGWSVFLLRVVVAFSYFQSGVTKLQNTGLGWVRPWRFQQLILEDSLTFFHSHWVASILSTPQIVWGILACAYLGLELFFPVILLFRPLRVIYLLAAVAVRSLLLFPLGIFYHDLILLQFIFYDWDRILPFYPVPEQERRKGGFFFRFRKNS